MCDYGATPVLQLSCLHAVFHHLWHWHVNMWLRDALLDTVIYDLRHWEWIIMLHDSLMAAQFSKI